MIGFANARTINKQLGLCALGDAALCSPDEPLNALALSTIKLFKLRAGLTLIIN